jgi:predicted nucleic acid-binding protein
VILVDTPVWVDHLRSGDKLLARLLDSASVLGHPFVIGELALGHLRQRQLLLRTLADLPQVAPASDTEVLHYIEQHRLFGLGLGYVDAHLLAALQLATGAKLWTRDKQLHKVADRLGMAAGLP